MWRSKEKIKLNKAAFKITCRGIDPYNTVNAIPEWLSKQLKDFITLPLAIASTIFTHSKFLIISNLLVVFIHLTSYLYGLFKQTEDKKNHKIAITTTLAILSILLFYAILSYSIPHVAIANQLLRFLFELNIWASAASLYLSCRNFILSIWYCLVRYLLTPIYNWLASVKTDEENTDTLKCLYKNIFFFRKQITDENAIAMGYRYVLDQFMLNLSGQKKIQSPCQKSEATLIEASKRFNKVLKFLVKRVNIKHYSLFGFLANLREIEYIKTLIDKLLRKGDIIDIILFVQGRINYKLTQITQIEELLSELTALQTGIKPEHPNVLGDSLKDSSFMNPGFRSLSLQTTCVLPHALHDSHTTDCCPSPQAIGPLLPIQNDTTNLGARLRPPMRLPLHQPPVEVLPLTAMGRSQSFPGTSQFITFSKRANVTAADAIRFQNAILRVFNLTREALLENRDNCQEEIRAQLEKQKGYFFKEVDKLTSLMPRHVKGERMGSPSP